MIRRFKWLLVIIALSLLALTSISPFLTDALPLSDDANLHIYRSIVLDDAMRHDGSWYPRFASALAYGYGASLFNYFPPTSYYPTVIFHALGLDWVIAWKATIIAYVLLAGLGTFLWARQWVDDIGAFIAAAAYIYAPYTLFDTVTRGSSNEFAGMALLPFALWGFTKLARFGRSRDYLIAIISYVLFIMAHNVMTLYGSLLLIAYCGFLLFTSENPWRVFWQLATAGIFSVLITAFFWMPALLETDFVKINGVLENLDFVAVTNTLRDLGAVFALPQTADPTQLQASIPISLSWILIPLAIIGFFLPQPPIEDDISQKSILGLHLLLFSVLGIVIVSQLAISADVWESVWLLQYSQFAWRPLSIGSLVLALLGAIGGSYLIRLLPYRISKLGSLGLLLTLIILYSVPWLYRPEINLVAETVADAQAYEIVSRQPVLSSYGEYLPAQTVQAALDPMRFVNPSSRLPESDQYTIISIEESSRRLSAELDVSEATTVIIDWLYVPGWQVRLNGQKGEVVAVGDAGLVGFTIDEGVHSIEVWYGQTTTQKIAGIISLISVLIVLVIILRFPKIQTADVQKFDVDMQLIIVVGIVGIGLFGLKTVVIDRINSPLKNARFQDGILNNVDGSLNVNFNNEILLLGIDREDRVASGNSIDIHLYWTVQNEAINSDYSSLVQLVDSQGIVVAEASNFYPGGLASSNWLPDTYVEDVIHLNIPDFTPPSDYSIVVGVFQSETGQRLDILNQIGNPSGIEAKVSVINITPPDTIFDAEQLPLPIITVAGFDLLSIEGLPGTAQVGDEIIMSWLWRANNPQNPFIPQLNWGDIGNVRFPELMSAFPITAWQSGDVWRGYQRFYLPANIEAGDYQLSIQVGERETAIRHNMQVTVPERNFDLPEIDNLLDTGWQNGITLLGYDQNDSSRTFYWQTNSLISQNLRLFVQVFNAEGRILAIDDGIPVNNQRPTTSWIRDEIISTSHTFADLPDGEYRILIGWYDALTGQRVVLFNSDEDALSIEFSP